MDQKIQEMQLVTIKNFLESVRTTYKKIKTKMEIGVLSTPLLQEISILVKIIDEYNDYMKKNINYELEEESIIINTDKLSKLININFIDTNKKFESENFIKDIKITKKVDYDKT